MLCAQAAASNGQRLNGSGAVAVTGPSGLTPEVVFLVAAKDDAGDNVSPLKVVITRVGKTGKRLQSRTLDTSTSGLNMYSFFSSGGAMEWDVRHATNVLGLMLPRTMLQGGDGLNHQGCIAVTFDPATLEVIKNYGQTSGHSFAQAGGTHGPFLPGCLSLHSPMTNCARTHPPAFVSSISFFCQLY
jgi:hypothetical protein